MNITLLIKLLIITSVTYSYCCDMFAIVRYNAPSTSIPHLTEDSLLQTIYRTDPISFTSTDDLFTFLGQRSSISSNSDGYGLVIYEKKNSIHRYHQMGFDTYFQITDTVNKIWQSPLLQAFSDYKKLQPSIILGHSRNATGGTTIGNHPFVVECDFDNDSQIDKTFTFEHNGDCTSLKKHLLTSLLTYDNKWFQRHPLNWASKIPNNDTLNSSYMIDSELLFHFIISRIEIHGGKTIYGIQSALKELGVFNGNFYHTINFIMSDGQNVYVFRNSEQGSGFNLEYGTTDNTIFIKTKSESFLKDIATNNLFVANVNGWYMSLPLQSSIIDTPVVSFYKKEVPDFQNTSYYSLNGRKILKKVALSHQLYRGIYFQKSSSGSSIKSFIPHN